MRLAIMALLISLQLLLVSTPVLAAYGPTTITVSIEEGFWDKYHIVNPASANGDVEKIYKIKKVELRLVAGEREFGSHTFTSESSSPRKFNLLHGVVGALIVRVKASAAEENVIWISSHPYQYAGNDIVIKAIPSTITVNYPGI